MRRKDNQTGNREYTGKQEISNSRAMGVIVLIALLFVYQVVTFVLQKIRQADAAEAAQGEVQDVVQTPLRFRFNPNTITMDSLQMLGFTEKQAGTILNYRSKGGKFRRKEDFARMYVVDSATYSSLEEYIFIPDNYPSKERLSPVRKKGVPVGRSVSEGNKSPKEGVPVSGTPYVGSSTGKNESGKESIYGSRADVDIYVCNLNTADSSALVELYGIGGYYANKILEYRERLGGSFVHKRQLLEIDGFSQQRYERIEDNVVVKDADVKGFSLLGAERKALERHPYIGPYAARGILTYIRLKGKEAFADELQLLEELVKEHIISENNALRLREYLLHL